MNLRMSHPLDFVLHLWGRHTTMSHNPNYLDFVPHLLRRTTCVKADKGLCFPGENTCP